MTSVSLTASPLLAVVRRWLIVTDRGVSRGAVPLFLVSLCLTAVFVSALAANRPFDHDEVYSLYASDRPELGDVRAGLLQGGDIHPPLDYWIRYFSIKLIGPSEMGLRLPSILAFSMTLLLLFFLCRRVWGGGPALAATAVLLVSQANSTAYFGRPYSFVLLWCVLGLTAWYCAAMHERRTAALWALAGLSATAALVHYYLPFQFAAIGVAEIGRSLWRRKLDPPVWVALGAFVFSIPLVLPHAELAPRFAADWTPTNLQATLEIYSELFRYGIPAILIVLVTAMAFSLTEMNGDAVAPGPSGAEEAGLAAAAIYLCALPFPIFVLARLVTNALFPRYCIALTVGAALLGAMASRRSPAIRLAFGGPLLLLALGVLGVKSLASLGAERPGGTERSVLNLIEQTDSPVVVGSTQTYLQTFVYADTQAQSRLHILRADDPRNLLGGLDGLAVVSSTSVEELDDFLSAHQEFLLLDEGSAILPALVDRGAVIRPSYQSGLLLHKVSLHGNQDGDL